MCEVFNKVCLMAGMDSEKALVTRKAERVFVRQIAHYIRFVLFKEGLSNVARKYGIHHSTIYNSVERVEEVLYLNRDDRKTAMTKLIIQYYKNG